MAVPRPTAPARAVCPVPAPATSLLLLAAQATALAATCVVALWRLALDLPRALLAAAAVGAGVAAPERGGALFYEAVVRHRRTRPVVHEFSYPVRLALINLDSPPAWFAATGQAARHMTPAAARAAAAGAPSAAAARVGPASPVWLLTNPHAAGYHQNPISVYYVWSEGDGDGGGEGGGSPDAPPARPPAAAVAEVTNTPWGAASSFAFDPAGDAAPKCLHVSPFMDMAATWRLAASAPGWRLALTVASHHPTHGAFFTASLAGVRCVGEAAGARNERAGLGVLLRYGYQPHRIALWIYLHAAALALKGVPFYGPPPTGTPRADAAARDAAPSRWRVWAGAASWPWNAAPCGV